MDCCNNGHDRDKKPEQKKGGKHRGHMPHMLMMALCCGAPLILLLLLPAIGSVIPGAGAVIGKIVPFLCPLMMLLMLPMMFGRNKEDGTNSRSSGRDLSHSSGHDLSHGEIENVESRNP